MAVSLNKYRLLFGGLLVAFLLERFLSYAIGLYGIPELPTNYLYLFAFFAMLPLVDWKIAVVMLLFAVVGVWRAIYLAGDLEGSGEFISFAAFCLACFAANSSLTRIKIKEHSKWLLRVVTVLAVALPAAYLASVLIGGVRYVEVTSMQEGYYGFIWPHGFGYFMALFALILSQANRRLTSASALLIGLISNSRTALLVLVFAAVDVAKTVATRARWLALFAAPVIVAAVGIAVALMGKHYEEIPALDRLLTSSMTIDGASLNARSLEVFTSGRSLFWTRMAESFYSDRFEAIDRFLGIGAAGVRQVNFSNVGMDIWMHNDWMQALYAYGYLGLAVYATAIWSLLRSVRFRWVLVAFVLVTSNLNGLYTYAGVTIVFLMRLMETLGADSLSRRRHKGHIGYA